ncbi:MAG: hypothetical protein GTN37_04005 [Candidatus Aenigmarchaeota archaeon]|nr:hypothetical protein [Candidatus Aenigmarchaeota archaeon]NIS73559.1 hypothetical protein [Candidatus Aenigmarchaeota archaeon]
MKENEKYAKMLEEFDRTGNLPLEKILRSFTIRRSTFKALKNESKRTGKSMSNILDELVEKKLS